MCGEGGYNARGGGDRGMREWRGGPEVIRHSLPSFASPRPRSCVVHPPCLLLSFLLLLLPQLTLMLMLLLLQLCVHPHSL